ncbi:MAG: RagB/SusD family nutrient uptake outer membrane protein [Candidatus Cryptobacteroides sp.]|jgi:hypothetical protein
MKKIISITILIAGLFSAGSCSNNLLDTSSPSIVDADFVFSSVSNTKAAMVYVYETWRNACQSTAFGDGLYYALDVCGSDIERHPESFSNQPARHWPECLYQNGAYTSQYSIDSYGNGFSNLYSCIAAANNIINAMANSEKFESFSKAGEPTELGQLYGEAVCARAVCYRELIKYFGDVSLVLESGVAGTGLAPRDFIYEYILNDLEQVIPMMYPIGSVPGYASEKNVFSRTFADLLAARMYLDAAGYQTRRADLGADFYKGLDGKVLSFEKQGIDNANADNAFYARRTDYLDLYQKARGHFKAVIDNPGSALWHDTDPRGSEKDGKRYGNPYQYYFQQNNDLVYADESIYEYAMTQGYGNDARPYSYGRVSSGGGSAAFPCKSYGQGRINPAFYWGVFDPLDMRRDVSACVTGSMGNGSEKLISFKPNSKAEGGGITFNKWDENRMERPYCLKQRQSGIKGPYMRIAEAYLGYAECCAVLGDEAQAKTYLAKVRERSFPKGQARTEEFIASCGSVFKAVIHERGFEYAAEGDRRWTLIRTGLLAETIRNFKELTRKMIDGLEQQGYYRFANGNEIPAYVWTKLVDAKSTYGYRLTTQTPVGEEDDPVLYPGWRGQNDDWAAAGRKIGVEESKITKTLNAGDKTNLAIKGLFKYIDPASQEAADLEADGYQKVEYGLSLVTYRDEYYKYFFYDYDYQSAPIYLFPFSSTQLFTGGFTNGYGLRQE